MTRSGNEKRQLCELKFSAFGFVSTTAYMHICTKNLSWKRGLHIPLLNGTCLSNTRVDVPEDSTKLPWRWDSSFFRNIGFFPQNYIPSPCRRQSIQWKRYAYAVKVNRLYVRKCIQSTSLLNWTMIEGAQMESKLHDIVRVRGDRPMCTFGDKQ